ncbi:hypothetical protein KNE206_44780 [Kitasatospora sp. NE20-6]
MRDLRVLVMTGTLLGEGERTAPDGWADDAVGRGVRGGDGGCRVRRTPAHGAGKSGAGESGKRSAGPLGVAVYNVI